MTEKDKIGKKADTTDLGEETVQIDWQRYEQPSLGLIEAIASVTGKRPTDMPPLGNELAVDAMNRLLSTADETSSVEISFEYQQLSVTVRQSGTLVVESITGE